MAHSDYFVHSAPLRWSDRGAHGGIDDIAQIGLVREAVLAFLEPRPDVFPYGVTFVRHDVEFHRELGHRREPLPIEIWVDRIRDRSFRLQSRARAGGAAVLSAKSVIVAREVAPDRRVLSRPLNAAEREYLQGFEIPKLRRRPS
ncbi:hypothetical protein ACFQVC_28050 [Streptomyces monticola]|uniref:Acyl-CoA thioesterase n=1 Tax=Streptomyces monticola TaxID=2666263 RepID=A0ABW2JQZ6_9ACTN